MKIRTIFAAAAAPAALAAVLLGTAGQASAAVHPAVYHHPQRAIAVAGAEITTPGYERYAQVLALQGYGHNKGYVQYTNFNAAEPGSGVWAPAPAADALGFQLGQPGAGMVYPHTLNGASLVLKALGLNRVQFTGSGEYVGPGSTPADTWSITGVVRGDHVRFTITYGAWGGSPAYTVTAQGTIASDGSASGTALGNGGSPAVSGQKLSWTLDKGTFREVDNFRAPVTSDSIQVKGQNATVSFVIPAPAVSAGLPITWVIHNGHSPAKDTWLETDGTGASASSFAETVEAGHILMLP